MLRRHGVAGATVIRGLIGFGPRAAHVPAGAGYLLGHVPVVIECVDDETRIRGLVPELRRMLVGGLITLEQVEMIVPGPASA